MKELPKLSEASERRISQALVKIAELIENGTAPNDAIVKVASAERIPAGQVRLMVRAFNTGRSLEHIRSHDTLEEKAAAFGLADASEVLERMWPSKVKTAAELHTATAISDDYGRTPDAWLRRRTQANVAPMTKAAASKVEPYPTYPERAAVKIASDLQQLRRDEAEQRQTAVKMAYAVVSTMDKVAEYFRKPDGVPFTVARHNASLALGQRVKKLMQKVATDKTVLKRFRDEIRTKNAALLNHPVDWKAEPYSLIRDALDAVDKFAAEHTKLAGASAIAKEAREELLRPFAVEATPRTITGSAWREKTAGGLTSSAPAPRGIGAMGVAAGSMIGNTAADLLKNFAPKSRDDLVQSSMDSLADPEHEDNLRAIRAQSMMHEMMAGDPIIRGYPHEDVLRAYNHLSEIAPRAMQTRIMAQSMLRRYLEQSQSLDPFDADQMLGINDKLQKRDMPESLAKGGWRVGPMRGMGDPEPSQSISLQPKPTAKGWPGVFTDAGQGLANMLKPKQEKSEKPEKPEQPAKPEKSKKPTA